MCVSKKTQTSPIPLAKLGEPILLVFCTATQLCDVIIYSGRRLNIVSHFVFTGGGSNFPLLSRVSILTRDIYIAILSVGPGRSGIR